jgi:hypothetical protein
VIARYRNKNFPDPRLVYVEHFVYDILVDQFLLLAPCCSILELCIAIENIETGSCFVETTCAIVT